MPFRNASATLSEALASIYRQSLKEFELIAVNDGSEDNGAAIIETAGDNRLRLLHNPGSGLVNALNFGISQSKANWIVRMDADDIMRPNRLKALESFVENKPDLDLVASRVEIFPREHIQEGYREYQRWQNLVLTPDQIANNIYIESPFAHPSVMIKKSAFERIGGYQEGDFPEDYELWLRMFHRGMKMEKIPEVLLDWRDTPGRLSRTDPAYRREAFDRIRARYLARDSRLDRARPLVIWGAGRKTRKRANHLLLTGFTPTAWIDIDPRKIGNIIADARVHDPGWLADRSPRPFVLSYVTNHGAREDISNSLKSLGYQESRDYLHVG